MYGYGRMFRSCMSAFRDYRIPETEEKNFKIRHYLQFREGIHSGVLQRTAAGRHGCNRRDWWPPSLRMGR
jgi:hypothetical protein